MCDGFEPDSVTNALDPGPPPLDVASVTEKSAAAGRP